MKRTEAERPRLSDEEVFGHYARTGSEESFQTIFKRYQPRIHGFLVKRINDPVIADDLTQNIFVRILRNANKFDTNRDFSKWVFTIVNNVLKNHYRTLSRDRMHAFTDMQRGSFAPTLAASLKCSRSGLSCPIARYSGA